MFTLWSLIEASLLCLNAVCILHEERFLAKGMYFILTFDIGCFFCFEPVRDDFNEIPVGWGATTAAQSFGEPTMKAQLLNLIRSIRTVSRSIHRTTYPIY